MADCYRCGSDTHLYADCPRRQAPPPAAPSPASGQTARPLPPPVPPRKPEQEIADAHSWATAIREALGWPVPAQGEEHNRRVARDQAAESRRRRDLCQRSTLAR